MRRAALILLALLILLPVAAVLGGGALLNGAAMRTRLDTAVQRATGHPLRLDGPIGLAWSLAPTIELRDAALLNPPGFSRPDLATVGRLAARIRLLPLLLGRVELASITLADVDVLLERDASGHPNWLPPPRAEAAAPDTAPSHPKDPIRIDRIMLDRGRIALRDGPAATVTHLELAPTDGTMQGDLTVNGVPLAITGTNGTARIAATTLTIDLARTDAGGWTITGQAADLAALSPLVGRPMPPLHEVRLTGQGTGGAIQSLHLTAGPSDLSVLRLGGLDLAATDAGPIRVAAFGLLQALPFTLTAQGAPLASLFGPGPLPIQATVAADGATLAFQGNVADLSGRGLQGALTARVPDLRRTGALAAIALPALTGLTLDARLLPGPGQTGVVARGVRLTSGQGDLAGDLAFALTPRPTLRGTLVSRRLDLDAAAAPPPTPSPATPAAAPQPASPTPPAPQSQAPQSQAPLPFARLHEADADLQLRVGTLVLHEAEYHALEARLLLQNGRLRLDPVQLQGSGGPIQATLSADADTTAIDLGLHAAGLDATSIATAAGARDALTGTLDLDIALRAHGPDWRALLATLDGHAGIALVDGDIENAALTSLFGPALRAANLPIDGAGRSRVRCFALRFDATAGQGQVRALALDTSRLRLDGEGSIDLVAQTLDLHLRPTVRIGSTGVVIPVRLTGPIAAPKPALERGAVAPGRLGISIGAAAPDPCGPALLAARDGRVGALPR